MHAGCAHFVCGSVIMQTFALKLVFLLPLLLGRAENFVITILQLSRNVIHLDPYARVDILQLIDSLRGQMHHLSHGVAAGVTWAVYIDKLRLDGSGGHFSAFLPASFKNIFQPQKEFLR